MGKEKPDPFRVSSTLKCRRLASRQGSDCDGDGADSTNPAREVRPVNVEANVRDVRGAAVGMCGGCGQMLLGFMKF
ncbi:hypothetical protein V6Z12_D05G318600 [Gossypium hirsutum]